MHTLIDPKLLLLLTSPGTRGMWPSEKTFLKKPLPWRLLLDHFLQRGLEKYSMFHRHVQSAFGSLARLE